MDGSAMLGRIRSKHQGDDQTKLACMCIDGSVSNSLYFIAILRIDVLMMKFKCQY